MNKVLIIDDEEKLRTLLSKIISLEGFEVLQAGDGKKALQKLETTNIDVVICDVKLPDGNGVELAKTIKDKYPLIEIILLTAYGNIPDGVQAIKNGAFDYITKGDDNNRIIPLLYKATEKAVLAKRVLQLEKQLGNKHSFENIIGKSKNIKAAIEAAKKVASTDATVLLTGETGTGKEVFAQAMVIFTVYIGTIIMLGVCICIAAGETPRDRWRITSLFLEFYLLPYCLPILPKQEEKNRQIAFVNQEKTQLQKKLC